jgi:hypothetical protein
MAQTFRIGFIDDKPVVLLVIDGNFVDCLSNDERILEIVGKPIEARKPEVINGIHVEKIVTVKNGEEGYIDSLIDALFDIGVRVSE